MLFETLGHCMTSPNCNGVWCVPTRAVPMLGMFAVLVFDVVIVSSDYYYTTAMLVGKCYSIFKQTHIIVFLYSSPPTPHHHPSVLTSYTYSEQL